MIWPFSEACTSLKFNKKKFFDHLAFVQQSPNVLFSDPL